MKNLNRVGALSPGSSFSPFQFPSPNSNAIGRRRKLPMNRPTHLPTTVPPALSSTNRSPLWHRFPFGALAVALAFFVLSLAALAVSPAPDGAYPNGNTAEGDSALFSLSDGTDNVAIGAGALYSNTRGNYNTANGFQTLNSNTTGSGNTANGYRALLSNTTINENFGEENTATGFESLYSNTTGAHNTANGSRALYSNTTASYNSADGAFSLFSNTTGGENTANGYSALYQNTTASNNTADGAFALSFNTTGTQNTAIGAFALYNNTSANNNAAEGFQALLHNTGSNNIAMGSNAGANLTTGSNNIDIGAPGIAAEANTISAGKQGTQKNTFVAGIFGTAVTGTTVIVNSTGKLGVATSSARFKEAIKPMDKTSDAIFALKPVTFRYKREIDPDLIPQFGLVAEEVEKVN